MKSNLVTDSNSIRIHIRQKSPGSRNVPIAVWMIDANSEIRWPISDVNRRQCGRFPANQFKGSLHIQSAFEAQIPRNTGEEGQCTKTAKNYKKQESVNWGDFVESPLRHFLAFVIEKVSFPHHICSSMR